MALLLSCVALQYLSSWAPELSYVAFLLSCMALQYPSSLALELSYVALLLSYVALRYPSSLVPELSYMALLLSCVAFRYPGSLAHELSYVALSSSFPWESARGFNAGLWRIRIDCLASLGVQVFLQITAFLQWCVLYSTPNLLPLFDSVGVRT